MPDHFRIDTQAHLQPAHLAWCRRHDVQRAGLERYVSDVYERAYRARLEHFHDLLMGIVDGRGELMGVIGTTPAAAQPRLFVEQYLDEPLEAAAARVVGRPCAREDLVEVGNLASRRPGTGGWLVSTLAHALAAEGRRFAVFAATTALRNSFDRMGVATWDLGPADGARLGDDVARWGTYYDTRPRVLVMDIAGMCRAATSEPRLLQSLAALWSAAHEAGRRRAGERVSA